MFASIFVSLLSIFIEAFVQDGSTSQRIEMPHSGVWL
jgi:hypothetical protein